MTILIVLTGGIACYKSLELIRLLKKQGHTINVIMTESAKQFVSPLSVSSLTGNQVYQELFTLDENNKMQHIEPSRNADCIIIAPATANFIAKIANGVADDLASTTCLARNIPLYIAPAMNKEMWNNPALQRNLKQVTQDGCQIIAPTDGELACGEVGPGRMAEPESIAREIIQSRTGLLSKYKALVTVGATIEPIDPVRYISNHSSGKQGMAVARALEQAGAEVTIIAGNHSAPAPTNVKVVHASSAEEMLDNTLAQLPVDIAIFTAAVCDYRMESPAPQKHKKDSDHLTLNLVKNPEIVTAVAKAKKRPAVVIGFAAETEKLVKHAKTKLKRKCCDAIIANDVSNDKVFGQDSNQAYWITATEEEPWPKMTKDVLAQKLIEKIIQQLNP